MRILETAIARPDWQIICDISTAMGYPMAYRHPSEIWDELAAKQARMSIHSQTGAMADLFEGQKDRLSEYLKAFHLVDSQVGGLFAINGKVAGLECFGHWQTFSKFFKKLVQSYALDAVDMFEESKVDHVAAADIRRFMEGIQKAPRKSYPSLGLGENIRAEGPFVSGAALVYNESVFHLSAFAHEGNKERAGLTNLDKSEVDIK